ncbi:MAG: M48 family metalloprotease [Saprospiraceae bacterium]|nr:M48 family metalloprotease [Saprospiraceae bacterium]
MNDALLVLTRALGWAVLHSLWQIAIVYAFYQAFCFLFRKNEQRLYLAALVAMVVVFAAFTTTVFFEVAQAAPGGVTNVFRPSTRAEISQNLPSTVALQTQNMVVSPLERVGMLLEQNAPMVGMAWCVFFFFFAFRLWGGYWRLQHTLKRESTPAPGQWQARCDHWVQRLGINRTVRLLESIHISEPVAVGILKPVIIVPAGMLLQLPPDQVEALLLHELAHIRRADYLVNILQLTLEAVFFYHPLFGLISRDARRRREHCCDDVALSHGSNPVEYAQTLVALKMKLNKFTKHQLIMQTTGKSGFAARIRRIVEPQTHKAARPAMLLPLALLLTAAFTLHAGSEKPVIPVSEPVSYSLVMPERPAEVLRRDPEPALVPVRNLEKASTDSLAPGQPEVAMELTKMNVVYIGVDNPLNLAVQGHACEDLEARLVGAGSLQPLGGCQYNIMVSKTGTVDVEVWDKTGKRIAVKTFRVKRVPDPTPTANLYRNQKLTVEELLEIRQINALLYNFDFDAECTVVGYELTVVNPREDAVMRYNTGALLDQGCLTLLKNTKPGAKIYFDEVKCKCPGDAAVRHLGGVSYTVAE